MDYTKKENRIAAVDKLNADCLKAFKHLGMKLSSYSMVKIYDDYIELSHIEQDKKDSYFGRSAFASELSIRSDYYFSSNVKQRNTISVGSCGSFSPENKAPYWRAIHAGEVLKNWKSACDIVNIFCKKRRELVEEIHQQNK